MAARSRTPIARRAVPLVIVLVAALSPWLLRPVLAQEQPPDYLSWTRPGPYRLPLERDFAVQSFGRDQRVVATYFFYWLDADWLRARRGQLGFDPYPLHPPDLDTMSFRDPAWYERQFRDMLAAGIDVVLPDYWGEPGQYNRRVAPAPELNYFATQGIPPMIQALDRLADAGTPLKVGLFLDTTILNQGNRIL
jgi:hypothetical protein